MKQVTIVVPKGNANLSSITGSFEILSRANEYWQKLCNKRRFEIRIAGFETGLKLGVGFFSVYPADITEIKKTDLLIIPSISYDYDYAIKENAALISWIREQY